MSRGAFSDLKLTPHVEPPAQSHDQRLFGPLPVRGQVYPPVTAQERGNAGARGGDNAPTPARGHETTHLGESAGAKAAARMPARPRNNVGPRASTQQRTSARAPIRSVERHSHDIFQDQVRWMNRLKLDLEERHGVKVTGNAMVQLALDIFLNDFERNGDESNLIRVLVNGETWRPENGHAQPGEPGREEAGE